MPILPWPRERDSGPKPMPTRIGDVVISHPSAKSWKYFVWRVFLNRQQVVNSRTAATAAIGGSAAMALARLMVREQGAGAIYFLQEDTLTWTKLSD
jgi:hypothetical protein